ncbi:cytochrome P450 [Streptomyces sp. NRRL WC-3742]|uniref:cytochrome P450 n=1 Tax=Streptomyces sp. NRRL WC-3742 TaxID=1463934 RepID=UPI0004CC647D|nr:cytochrome P450 [Streptomyces sp. NRRL WC-3742]
MTPPDTRTARPGAPAFPMARGCPYRMPDGYELLRAAGPLSRVTLHDGSTAWLVSGSEEGRALLLDARLSVDVRRPGFPTLSPQLATQSENGFTPPLSGVDDPEHAHQRRLVIPGYGIRRIAAMRPEIERTAEQLLDAMLTAHDRRADLVADYTLPLACAAGFALLGVPPEDGRHIAERTRRVLCPADEAESADAPQNFTEVLERLRQVLDREEHQPGLIAELLGADTEMDRDQLTLLCAILLTGGDDTTSSTVAAAVLALLQHPDQLGLLREDPTLLPGAVDELTRYTSVADVLPRIAVADLEIAGHTVRAGEGVLISTMLMNRDPAAWPDPDTLDLTRRAGRHVAFGYGVHQCVGQNLARAVIETALATLLRRAPGLRLAVPADRIRANPPYVLQGSVSTLPVTW